MSNHLLTNEPGHGRIEIFGFSPVFGFFRDALAIDLGLLPGETRLSRVLLDGDVSERICPVFPELQGCLDAKVIAALNELVFSRACDFPLAEEFFRIRALDLSPRGRR